MTKRLVLLANNVSHVGYVNGTTLHGTGGEDIGQPYQYPTQVNCGDCLNILLEEMGGTRHTVVWSAEINDADRGYLWPIQTELLGLGAAVAHIKPMDGYSKLTAVFAQPVNLLFPLYRYTLFHDSPFIQLMSREEFVAALDVTPRQAAWWFSSKGGDLRKWELTTAAEFVTQRCDQCNEVIQVHENPNWRVKLYQVRCQTCASFLIDQGWREKDALYLL